jgi:hypothetical protein
MKHGWSTTTIDDDSISRPGLCPPTTGDEESKSWPASHFMFNHCPDPRIKYRASSESAENLVVRMHKLCNIHEYTFGKEHSLKKCALVAKEGGI